MTAATTLKACVMTSRRNERQPTAKLDTVVLRRVIGRRPFFRHGNSQCVLAMWWRLCQFGTKPSAPSCKDGVAAGSLEIASVQESVKKRSTCALAEREEEGRCSRGEQVSVPLPGMLLHGVRLGFLSGRFRRGENAPKFAERAIGALKGCPLLS